MKANSHQLLLLVLLLMPFLSKGQNTEPVCGTERLYERIADEDPSLRRAEERANEYVRKQLAKAANRAKKSGHEKVIVPVVVHVLHNNGPEKISKRLNKDFQLTNSDTSRIRDVFSDRVADFKYEFRLANKTPKGQCTDGITYTQTDLTDGDLWLNNMPQFEDQIPYWNPEEYLNIWSVRQIFDRSDDFSIAGQANFPWDSRGFDGILSRSDQFAIDDRTLTHEVGHYIGLYHPFQDGCTGSGDRVGDTPPVEERSGIIECDFNLNTCGGQFPDMVENYMDYTECGVMFTDGQFNRAQQFMEDPFRGELVSDSNLAKTGVLVRDKPPKITGITAEKDHFYTCESVSYSFQIDQTCEQGSLNFGAPSNIEWQFNGGTPQTSNESNPLVKYDKPGIYKVSLKLTNQSGTDEVVKTRFVRVLGDDKVLEPPFLEGFEDGELDREGIISLQKKDGPEWQVSNKAASFGNASFYFDNFNTGDDQVAQFRLPRMNLSGVNNPTLQFDIAFATIGQSSDDLLEIFFSTDCGKTWTKRKELFSFLAKTSDNETNAFIPDDDEWKTEDLRLPSDPNVLVRFDWNTSTGGNNAYIDNIRMNWTVGRSEKTLQSSSVEVYPNPTSGAVSLKNDGNPVNGNLQVVNSTGKTLYSKPEFKLQAGGNKTFEASQLNIRNPGVYYLNITGANQTITRKIVVVE